jgi:hypothetical protein
MLFLHEIHEPGTILARVARLPRVNVGRDRSEELVENDRGGPGHRERRDNGAGREAVVPDLATGEEDRDPPRPRRSRGYRLARRE